MSNITEIKKELEQLTKKVAELEAKEEVILVPENIVFETRCSTVDGLGLVFDNTQVFYTVNNKPRIKDNDEYYKIPYGKLKLIKVDKPAAGNWYFCTDFDVCDLEEKDNYHKYVSNNRFYFIEDDTDIIKNEAHYKYYYQVVRVDE